MRHRIEQPTGAVAHPVPTSTGDQELLPFSPLPDAAATLLHLLLLVHLPLRILAGAEPIAPPLPVQGLEVLNGLVAGPHLGGPRPTPAPILVDEVPDRGHIA